MQRTSNRHPSAVAIVAALALALASFALAACGSSSHSATANTNASADASAPPTGGAAAGNAQGRFAKLRECLQKNGVTLPKRTPGQRPAPGSGPRGQGQLPAPTSRAKFQEAIKKCGGTGAGGFAGGARRFDSPAFRQSLAKFATCMREHGVNVPSANTSGNGPVFNTKGLNTNSTAFRNAEAKCRGDLSGSLRAHPGGASPPPTTAG